MGRQICEMIRKSAKLRREHRNGLITYQNQLIAFTNAREHVWAVFGLCRAMFGLRWAMNGLPRAMQGLSRVATGLRRAGDGLTTGDSKRRF